MYKTHSYSSSMLATLLSSVSPHVEGPSGSEVSEDEEGKSRGRRSWQSTVQKTDYHTTILEIYLETRI